MTIYTWNTDSAESYHCTNWKKQVGQFLRFALNLQCAIDTIILGGKETFLAVCVFYRLTVTVWQDILFIYFFFFFLIRK